jgi:hypothetical protein
MDWLDRSFNPGSNNRSWMEERFKLFCSNKISIDYRAAKKRLLHAPFHPKVVHKMLGRHHPLSSVLLHEEGDVFIRYVQERYGDYIPLDIYYDCRLAQSHCLALACTITGPLSDALLLVEAVAPIPSLQREVLVLFELVHMTYFCREEYLLHTEKTKHVYITYICSLVKKAGLNQCDMSFALDCDGAQTDSLLARVRSLFLYHPKTPTPEVHGIVPIGYLPNGLRNYMKGRLPLARDTHREDFFRLQNDCQSYSTEVTSLDRVQADKDCVGAPDVFICQEDAITCDHPTDTLNIKDL